MNRKIISILVVLTIFLAATACGANVKDKESDVTTGSGIEETEKTTDGAVTDGGIAGDGEVAGENEKPLVTKPSVEKPSAGDKPETGESVLSGSLESIMDKIYAVQTDKPNTAITEIAPDNQEYFLGNKELPIKQGIGSEPMMSSIAHSIVLIELNEGSNVNDIKAKIKANVNGRKWVCVGVEPENILVGSIGNFVLLVMDENPQIYMDNFLALGK